MAAVFSFMFDAIPFYCRLALELDDPFTAVTTTEDGYSFEWGTAVWATTPFDSS